MTIKQLIKKLILSIVLSSVSGVPLLQAQTPEELALSMANLQAQAFQSANQQKTGLPSTIQAPLGGQGGSVATPAEDEIEGLRNRDRRDRVVQFAADLFNYRQSMSSATDGGISEDYVVGTGDRLQIYVFGSATFETPVQVDGKGEVAIPKVGLVKVGGMSLQKAKQALQRTVGAQFSKAQVEVTVIKLREVRISILGEVYKPGTYLIPSLSSILNVLGMTGGPTRSGSFRDIRIVRAGKIVDRIDLYPLRGEGLGNLNVALQSGDVVYVPLASSLVTLEGVFFRLIRPYEDPEGFNPELSAKGATSRKLQLSNAREPGWWQRWNQSGSLPTMQFELKEGESFQDLVRWAGGVNEPFHSGVFTRRYLDAKNQWVSQTFTIASLPQIQLKYGDTITALPKYAFDATSIYLMGHIRVPGPYAFAEGIRIGDFIKKNQLLLPTTYLLRGEITRTSLNKVTSLVTFDIVKAVAGDPTHNVLLQEMDVVRFYSNEDLRIARYVRLVGPLTRAGTYELLDGMRVSDLIFRAGLVLPQAAQYRAELARTKAIPGQDATGSTIIPIPLDKLLSTETQSPLDLKDDTINPLLQPEDVISVFEIANFTFYRSVSLRGQVQRPGEYVLENSQVTLRQIIERAGGLTEKAFLDAAIFIRGSALIPQVQAGGTLNEILTRLSESKRDPLSGAMQSNPVRFGPAALSGRLILDFKKALTGNPQNNLTLINGDEIVIPEYTTSAYILGEVASPFGVYQLGNPNDRVRVIDMLKRAGNFTRNADAANVRLLKANGQIIDGTSPFALWSRWTYMHPGDTLLVPPKYTLNTTWVQDLTALANLALIYKVISP